MERDAFVFMKNALLIVNPCAGKMKSKTALFDIISTLCEAGYTVVTNVTQNRCHATELAKNADKENIELVVCCGGDGTLNEVITGLMCSEKSIPLGYIPTGSTNDFANSVGIPSEPEKAALNVVNGEDKQIDIGLFNERYFTYIASFGAFTSVSYTAPQSTKNVLGHLAYVLEGIKDITSIQAKKVRYFSKEKNGEGEYIFGCVANSLSIGGILKLDSKIVSMNDGLFEVLMVKMPKNINDLHKAVWGLINSDFSDEIFEFFKTEEITFNMPDDTDWSLDGEFAKGEEEIVVKNIKNAIVLKTT